MDLALSTTTYAQDDKSWLGSKHGTDCTRSIKLDRSAFTQNTHYPDGYVRSGTPLGKITASGMYGPYNNAASDGTEVLAGFLYAPVAFKAGNTSDPGGALFWHGVVDESKLPIAIDAGGRTDIAGRIDLI